MTHESHKTVRKTVNLFLKNTDAPHGKGGAMKILVVFLVLTSMVIPAAWADICVKEKIHTNDYYFGGQVSPEENRTRETWIGDKKMAVVNERRIIVFNLNDNVMFFINRDDSTYAETSLPMEWINLCDTVTAARVNMFPTDGVFEETGNTKKIDGKECKEYFMHSWIPYQGAKYNERESKIWATADVPFDADVYADLNQHSLKLQNFGDEFRAKLSGLRGLPLAVESENILKGASYTSSEKVVEIKKADPPEGIYGPPAGFTKKEKLNMGDLQGG